MSAALLEYALGNTLLAAPLAALAWALGRSGRCPAAAHLAWALVLVRLVLPPITDVPWLALRVPVAGVFGGDVAPAGAPAAASPTSAAAAQRREAPGPDAPSHEARRHEAQRRETQHPEPQRPAAQRADQSGRGRSPDANDRAAAAAAEAARGVAAAAPADGAFAASPTFGPMAPPAMAAAPRAATGPAAAPLAARSSAGHAIDPAAALAAVWLVGAALVAGWSLCRVVRFHRALAAASAPAGPALVGLAAQSARALRMPAAVRLRTTTARTSPFVWWCFGRPTIVLPTAVVAELPERELRLAITHELAHVRRRDHVLRWFEWAATAWLWWNPLAWLARRGLRVHEELACDALVLRTVAAEPRDYGSCLLSVAESLASPGLHPPAQACAMSDGGALAQRLAFILSDAPRRRPAAALHALPLAVACASLGFGVVATAQEPAPAPNRPAAAQPAQPAQPASNAPAAPQPANAPTPPTPPTPPGASPAPVVPAAKAAAVDEPAARTLRAVVADARAVEVATVQGDVAVRRDPSVKGLEITAVIRRAPGAGDERLTADEFAACVRDARLVANASDDGVVQTRVAFSDGPDGDAAAARKHAQRRDNSCVVTFVVRGDGLQRVVANSISGDLDVDGDFGAVTLSSVSGDVRAVGANGSVDATAVSGDVEVRGATGAVRAASTSGDVRLEPAAAAQGDLFAGSTTGAVDVALPAAWEGEYRVESSLGRLASTFVGADGRPLATRPEVVQVAKPNAPIRVTGTAGDKAKWRGPGATARFTTLNGPIHLRVRVPAAAGDGDAATSPAEKRRQAQAAPGAPGVAAPAPADGASMVAALEGIARAAADAIREGLAASAAASERHTVSVSTTIRVGDDGEVHVEVERPGADGEPETTAFAAPRGPHTLQIDDGGAVRVEIEQAGAGGVPTKTVYEAPDIGTFLRQHAGALLARDAGEEPTAPRKARGRKRPTGQ